MATRIILHSRSRIDIVYSVILILLLCVDIFSIFSLALDHTVWRKVYNSIAAKEKHMHHALKELSPKNSLFNSNDAPSPRGKSFPLNAYFYSSISSSRKAPKFFPIIDYDRTYDELDVNHHLVSVSSSSLMISRKVYLSSSCRLHLTLHSFRVGLYQLCIVAGQSCPVLVVPLVGLLELAKTLRSLWLQWRVGYLKSLLLLGLDVVQSVCMAAFFSLFALRLRQSPRDSIPSAGFQTAGIWLVVGSCLAEYLLLFAFVVLSCVEVVKRMLAVRRLKRAGQFVKQPHEFLRFVERQKLSAKKNLSESPASISLEITSPGRHTKGLVSPSQRIKNNEARKVKVVDLNSRRNSMRKLLDQSIRTVAAEKGETTSISPIIAHIGGKLTSRARGYSHDRIHNIGKISPRETIGDEVKDEIVSVHRKIRPVTVYRFSRSKVINLSPVE
jgi:hypothetical protein